LVFQWALSHSLNRQDAEEITQDVFVEVLDRAASFRGESKVSTWLYRITLNKAADTWRTKHAKKRSAFMLAMKRSNPVLPELPMFEHPEWSLEQKEAYAALYKAIEKLPQVQRQAFSMAYLDGLPQQEIAEVMQMKLKALESTLQRAKKTLKKDLNFLNETKIRKDFNRFNDK